MPNYLQTILGDSYKEGMTEEDISSALQELGIKADDKDAEEVEREHAHLRDVISKANSEASSWKKKYMSTLSQREQEEAERIENDKKRDEEVESLKGELVKMKRENDISKTASKLKDLGYETELATKTAMAILDGNVTEILDYQSKFLADRDARAKDEALKNTPRPVAGGIDKSKKMTLDDLNRMSAKERVEFARNNPDEYLQLNRGEEIYI